MLRVWHLLFFLISSSLTLRISCEREQCLSKHLDTDSVYADGGQYHYILKRAPGITLWKAVGDNDFKYPTFYGKDKRGTVNTLETDAEVFFGKVHDERRTLAQKNRRKPERKPELSPPGQDLVATMYIPGEDFGTWAVSTAEEDSPISEQILADMQSRAPHLFRAIGGNIANIPVPLHIEIVMLYKVEKERPDILAKYGGFYPRGTRLVAWGKYRSSDSKGTKQACLGSCQTIKAYLNV